MRELAYALAGGAKPAPWWSASHERVLASARALDWPAQTLDVEAQACRIVGDEFYEMLNSAVTGLAPAQWLVSLAEKAGAALNTAIRNGDGDWEQLWALLCGLALTAPAGDTASESAKLAREQFPDIKDPYETALAEAGKGAKLLADRGLVPGIGAPADGCRPGRGAAGRPRRVRQPVPGRGAVQLRPGPGRVRGRPGSLVRVGHRLVLDRHGRGGRGDRVGRGGAARMAGRRRALGLRRDAVAEPAWDDRPAA